VWRQRFQSGEAEQFTFGPTEEEGLAMAPDGRSLITAVSLGQRSVWVRDSSFERQISFDGYAYFPLLSADGQKVCFRVTRGFATGQSPSELWVADLRSGTKQRLFPEQLVTGYDVSSDDRVVAAVPDGAWRNRVWLASLDPRQAAQPIPGAEGDQPAIRTKRRDHLPSTGRDECGTPPRERRRLAP
jgi:eukaryotic-like serine/threonine-protein kinase